MYLDVRVSKFKVGRLGVRKGDDPDDLVNSFAKGMPRYVSSVLTFS